MKMNLYFVVNNSNEIIICKVAKQDCGGLR